RSSDLLILESVDMSWQEFLQALLFDLTDSRVTRLDIAMDERYLGHEKEDEQFLLSDMIAKVYKDEVSFKNIRTWNHIGGGNLRNMDDVEGSQGISLYFGSRQSNLKIKRSEEHTLNSSHVSISYAVFCLKKKTKGRTTATAA